MTQHDLTTTAGVMEAIKAEEEQYEERVKRDFIDHQLERRNLWAILTLHISIDATKEGEDE